MGLHSLNQAPSTILPPEGTVAGTLARVISFIAAHYEQEGPLHGYDQAATLLAEMRWQGNRVLDDLRADRNRLNPRALATLEAYLWDLGALELAVAQRAPRNDIRRLVAEVRRSHRLFVEQDGGIE